MREKLSDLLVKEAMRNKDMRLLTGDHGYALFDALRKNAPSQFINAGVAEQNMIGVGAGLSKVGFYPIIYGLSAFLPLRVLEQIKIDFCYDNRAGLLLGDGAGVVYSQLGTSHQSTEDIAVLRAIPNISILSPCDSYELEVCFRWATEQKSPVYMRLAKADLGPVHSKQINNFNFEPLLVIDRNSKHAIFATGSMVKPMQELINKYNLRINLYSVPVIKHKNKVILEVLSKYEKIISCEEHSIYGGLGDLLGATIAENYNCKFKKIGINDQFSKFCGTYDYLLKYHGLDSDSLYEMITKWFI